MQSLESIPIQTGWLLTSMWRSYFKIAFYTKRSSLILPQIILCYSCLTAGLSARLNTSNVDKIISHIKLLCHFQVIQVIQILFLQHDLN